MKLDPLVTYIIKESKKGFSEALIMEKLRQAKYSSEEIYNAFVGYQQYRQHHKIIGQIVDNETEKPRIIILALFIFTLLAVIIFLAFYFSVWHESDTIHHEPKEETDCSIFTLRNKERCIMKIAAYQNSTEFCINMTSEVMKYQCRTEVWNKNYCNFLTLTNQSTTPC